MHIFLETERLILRRFTEDDVDNLFELDGDLDVMRYITGGARTPREVLANDHIPYYLDCYTKSPGYGFWVALERESGDFLGWFHLRPQNEEAVDEPELGYRLRKSAWNKGYATEGSRALVGKGFTDFGARVVNAYTYEPHTASRRIMEKCGMRLIRTFKPTPEELFEYLGVTDPTLFPGEDVEYAITRTEWEEQGSWLS